MLVAVTAAGCLSMPDPPTLLNPQGPLVELSRSALPVPPDAKGEWPLFVPQLGLIGAGDRVARIGRDGKPLWIAILPAAFALTNPGPGGHSAFISAGGRALIVLGGGREPSAVLVLGLHDGAEWWRAALPDPPRGGHVHVSSQEPIGTGEALFVSTCGPGGCDVLSLNEWQGTKQGSWRVPGVTWMLGVTDPGTGTDFAASRDGPNPFVVYGGPGARLVFALTADPPVTADVVADWTVQIGSKPNAPIAYVMRTEHRTVAVTAPVDASCAAVAYGLAMSSSDTLLEDRPPRKGLNQAEQLVVWSQPFVWDDPRADRDAHGCRHDSDLPPLLGRDPVLPDKAGAMVIDEYTGRVAYRLSPGEHPVGGGTTWDGRGYRTGDGADARALGLPGPTHIRPWALDQSVVATADGISLHDSRSGRTLWHVPEARRAMVIDGDRLVLLTTTELIVVGPEKAGPSRDPRLAGGAQAVPIL
ncbi:hypothetical protein Afe04nite_05430 [Asanoa ferruginea]|nr:hypothetical protein Afe04nite_05430 [Asanoa ferruginea]